MDPCKKKDFTMFIRFGRVKGVPTLFDPPSHLMDNSEGIPGVGGKRERDVVLKEREEDGGGNDVKRKTSRVMRW